MKRAAPLLVVAIFVCVSCQAHIRMTPEEVSAPGSQSLGKISEADLDEKIARDMLTVRNVIDGLRTLEEQADDTTIAPQTNRKMPQPVSPCAMPSMVLMSRPSASARIKYTPEGGRITVANRHRGSVFTVAFPKV